MKLSIVTVAVATLAPLALARNCKGGLYYCGQTLLNIGNYRAQIVQALRDAGKPIDDNWVRGALFFCTGYDGGDIDFSKTCSNTACKDNGDNQSDTCS